MNYQNINHDSPRLDPGVDPLLQAYQADFADHVSHAGDAFVRGNLQGDVQFPKGPVYAHAVTEWEARTEPRLSPTHDAVGRALASFFTEDGGWVYLTQDMIADEARLRRQSVNRPLQDLVAAGRVERREMTTHQGHRGHAYRLTGEDTGWLPGVAGFLQIRITTLLIQLITPVTPFGESSDVRNRRFSELYCCIAAPCCQ